MNQSAVGGKRKVSASPLSRLIKDEQVLPIHH